jgi:hypothetical protein
MTDKEADRDTNDPQEGDECANSVRVADDGKRRDSDREQREAGEEPKGNEALPAIGLQASAMAHSIGSVQVADEST